MTRILYAAMFFLAACSADIAKQAAIPAGATVLILGDSLSYGTGAKPGQEYPALLAQTTHWQIINAGIHGDTTATGLARLPTLLDAHQPRLLMIELGGNDLLRHIPAAQVEQNLNNILALAKAHNVEAVLVAIPAISPLMAAVGHLSDHPMYARIAEETHTPLVSDVFSEVLSKRLLKSDQIHPNANGYTQVAVKMAAQLEALGYFRP